MLGVETVSIKPRQTVSGKKTVRAGTVITDVIVNDTMVMEPQTAREWRNRKTFERQRPMRPDRTRQLAAEMTKRRFTQGTQIFLAVLPNGAELILNGNHTLEAICLSKVPQILTVTRHKVVDIDAAGVLYATLDIQMKRTFVDALLASGVQLKDAPPRIVAAAVNCILGGFRQAGGKPVPLVDVAEAAKTYNEEAQLFIALAMRGTKNARQFLKRAPVMAVALETMRFQPSAGLEFWTNVANEDGLREGQPERTLLHYCRDTEHEHNRMMQARAAAMAWNAKFENKRVQSLKVANFKNFHILGTPHHSGLTKTA
jgi:hypothetical protein